MRRLSLRALAAFTVTAALASPAALAQYDRRDRDVPAAIALFSDENFYGDVRDVYDPFASLGEISFNDKPRSVAVFAGQWELCEHKNFTGRCVYIKEDVSDLGWFGLNGRITSVRPVYEYTEASHGLMFSRDRYGYIRYADDEIYGYDRWERGYASSWGLSVSHFGYSSDYYRYGYYNPVWGYDPYGFAWSPRGRVRYSSTYLRHPRPSVINPYWVGWDWRPSDWRHGHWSWRGNDWDDWRRDRRGHGDGYGDGRGHGGHGGDRDWRPDDDGGRGDRPVRDRPGDGWGPGRGGVQDPVAVDPTPGRGGRTLGTDPGIAVVPPVADPLREPRPGRGVRGSGPAVDTSGLLGGTVPDEPRIGADDSGDNWRRRGSDERRGGRFGDGMSGGGIFGTAPERRPEPAYTPPPPPPEPRWEGPAEVSPPAPNADSGGDSDGEGRRGRRRRHGDE